MNKLSGNQRKILNYIYKNRDKHLTRFNISDNLKSVSSYEIKIHLRELIKNEYIFYSGLNDTINLTSKGLSYFSYETQVNIEICIKSIICPIIIAFITAKITLWLSN